MVNCSALWNVAVQRDHGVPERSRIEDRYSGIV